MTLQQLGIDRMSVSERIDLLGQIWDSLIDENLSIEVPEAHRAELDRRLAAADANPEAAVPWESVKARMLGPS